MGASPEASLAAFRMGSHMDNSRHLAGRMASSHYREVPVEALSCGGLVGPDDDLLGRKTHQVLEEVLRKGLRPVVLQEEQKDLRHTGPLQKMALIDQEEGAFHQ